MKVLRIVLIIIIIFDACILTFYNIDNKNEVQVISSVVEDRNILNLTEDFNKNKNLRIINIDKIDGCYKIEIEINCNKDEYISVIKSLKGYLIQEYQLKIKDEIVSGNIILKEDRQ